MDSKVVKLLKIYENETGKDLLSKLNADRLKKLGFYYENLSEDEQQDIDLKIITGEDNDFIDVCLGLAGYFDEVEYDQGLRDLTEDVIEEEGGGSTALAVIPRTEEPASDEDLVSEDIDPRILRLLGLEDVFDIDYDTYKTLLKEKMAAGRMTDSQMPTEEVELLTDEFKRVKSKTGRFSVKKKTVSVDSFFDRGGAAETDSTSDKPVVTPAGLLPSAQKISKTVEDEQEEAQVEDKDNFNQKVLAPSLQKIDDNIQSILDTLKKQYDLEKKEAKRDERIADKERADKREAKLESGSKSKGINFSSLKNVAKPVTDLFGMMQKFLINTLLGGILMRVMDIINDPHKYLNPIKQFFINIIEWVEDTVQFIVDIPYNIYNSIATNLNAGIDAIESAINNALAFFKQGPLDPGPRLPKLDPPVIDIPIPDFLQLQPTNAQTQAQSQKEGGEVESNPATMVMNNILVGSPAMSSDTPQGNTTLQVSPTLTTGGVNVAPSGPTPIDVSMGGRIENRSINKVKGMGVDTQLVAAQPGEIMMSVPAVQAIGAENLLAANAAAGGTNKPKFGKFMGMQGGGMIGRQGSAPIRDFGMGGGAGRKGYILVPGHAAGGGAPGEMEMVVDLTQNVVDNLKNRFGNDIPIKIMNMHAETPNTYAAFSKQQDKLKELEKQGYEVIEIHMDASLESGQGTGRGLIAPMPGTDAINPVEADFARTAGAFTREHRGGLAATNRGVSIIELGNMSPELQKRYAPNQVQGTPGIAKDQLDIITKPLEDSLIRGMKLKTSANVVASDFTMGAGAIDAFDSAGTSPAPRVVPTITSTPAAQVTATQVYSQTPNRETNVQIVPVPSGNEKRPASSSAEASQKLVPPLNAEDANNFDMIVIKSIYNIVS